jgi:glycosyltransferase involved in cell wall biosynthesis
MRIGFVSTNDWVPWGGSEELWYQTAKVLKAQGIEVGATVAFWQPRPPHIQDLIDVGVSIDLRGQPVAKKSLLSRAFRKLKRMAFKQSPPVEDKFKFLDNFQPDLLVISQGGLTEGNDWKKVCQEKAIPYVAIVHLVGEYHWFNDQTADLLLEVYAKARCNYFVSQQNINLAERQLGQAFAEARVVRNPFKVPYDQHPSYPTTEPYFQLACVAALTTIHKGQDLLFEILKQDKWRNRPIRLNLYGKGSNENILKRLKVLWQLDMVEFKGFVDDVSSIWRENHALFMGSRLEGLPLSVVEAMLCQRVAIVPDVGGNCEVITDNVTGFIARSPTIHDIDEALERAWSRRQEWQMIGEAASTSIKQIIPPNPAQVFAQELIALLP